MFVETTHYFAKQGRADEVLQIRRRACVVRTQLGLEAGSILIKDRHQEDGPDVSWQCHYPSRQALDDDLAARATSTDFGLVRQKMTDAVDHFERHITQTDDTSLPDQTSPDQTPLDQTPVVASNSGSVSLADTAIVPRIVSFDSGTEQLTGYLYLPPGRGPFPCVITNHGSAIDQGTDDVCRPGMASLLMSWGYASFLPHRRGYGESTGTPWNVEVSAEFGTDLYDQQLVARLESESDDVVAAIDHVAKFPEVDADRMAVMGSSFGGTVTLWAATKASQICCAVDFAGAAINWDHTPQLRQAMIDATLKINCPIYFLQAANDYSVGPTQTLGTLHGEASHPISSKVFEAFGITKDEGHYFEKYGSLIWGPQVRSFLQRWL